VEALLRALADGFGGAMDWGEQHDAAFPNLNPARLVPGTEVLAYHFGTLAFEFGKVLFQLRDDPWRSFSREVRLIREVCFET
jgi:hypothetical protein